MPSDIACHFASARGVTDQRDILEIKRLKDCRQILSVSVHVVPVPGLSRTAMPTPVVCNHTEAILGEEMHLPVPSIGTQGPPVRKRYDRAFAPVLVVDRAAVFHRNCAHKTFFLKF